MDIEINDLRNKIKELEEQLQLFKNTRAKYSRVDYIAKLNKKRYTPKPITIKKYNLQYDEINKIWF